MVIIGGSIISRKLSLTEGNNSAFDQELLAAYSSIPYFYFLLEGLLLLGQPFNKSIFLTYRSLLLQSSMFLMLIIL